VRTSLDVEAVASINEWLATVDLLSSPAITPDLDPETAVVLKPRAPLPGLGTRSPAVASSAPRVHSLRTLWT
jgi:hypothetical protein